MIRKTRELGHDAVKLTNQKVILFFDEERIIQHSYMDGISDNIRIRDIDAACKLIREVCNSTDVALEKWNEMMKNFNQVGYKLGSDVMNAANDIVAEELKEEFKKTTDLNIMYEEVNAFEKEDEHDLNRGYQYQLKSNY